MAPSIHDTVSAEIKVDEALFRATGRTLKFDGYLRVDQEPQDQEQEPAEGDEPQEGTLPPLTEGASLKLVEFKPEDHETSPPPHYNEASLIRALEKHGIGRPSTYAPTIQNIVERGYVRRGLKDRTLTPTELGVLVTEKLKEHFPEVVNLSYTAGVEERLDNIAEGTERWQQVVQAFYDPFRKSLTTAFKVMEDSKPQESEEPCPLCGTKMLLRESRFGKYLSCPRFPQCKGKIRLTADGQKIVPQATSETCEVCGKPMVIRMGRRGRFLACSGYPACQNTYSLDEQGNKIAASRPIATERKCEKCGSLLWMRLGKRGHFLACSGFPKCRNLKPISKEDAEAIRSRAGSSAS